MGGARVTRAAYPILQFPLERPVARSIFIPTFPVYRKFYGGFIKKTRSESPRHAKILATKDFVLKPEGKSFKTAWIHKSAFFKEIPLARPNVPSNQEKALCEPGTKYPTQIPKPRECRFIRYVGNFSSFTQFSIFIFGILLNSFTLFVTRIRFREIA